MRTRATEAKTSGGRDTSVQAQRTEEPRSPNLGPAAPRRHFVTATEGSVQASVEARVSPRGPGTPPSLPTRSSTPYAAEPTCVAHRSQRTLHP